MLEGMRYIDQLRPGRPGPEGLLRDARAGPDAVQVIVNEARRALPADAAELRDALAAASRTLDADLEVVRSILDTAVIQSRASV